MRESLQSRGWGCWQPRRSPLGSPCRCQDGRNTRERGQRQIRQRVLSARARPRSALTSPPRDEPGSCSCRKPLIGLHASFTMRGSAARTDGAASRATHGEGRSPERTKPAGKGGPRTPAATKTQGREEAKKRRRKATGSKPSNFSFPRRPRFSQEHFLLRSDLPTHIGAWATSVP